MAPPTSTANPSPRLRKTSFLVLFSVFFFAVTTLILAAPRIVPRLSSLFSQLKYHRPPQSPHGGGIHLPSKASSASFLASTTIAATFATYKPILTHPTADMSKYANPPQPPPLFTGTKDSIVSDAQALCDKSRSLLDKLVAEIDPAVVGQATFDKVLLPQIEDENESSLTARILGFYQYVSSEEGLRNASTEAERLMDEFGIEMSMREDVFRLVDAVYQASGLKEAKEKAEDNLIDDKLAKELGLDGAESASLLDKERKSYIKNGLGLATQEQKDRFKEIKKRLSQIQIQFTKNLNEENGGIWFTPEQLDGVPKDVLDGLEKGTGENEGKLKLSFKYPDLFPTLKFAKNPETRKKLFIENENKVWHLSLSSFSQWLRPCVMRPCVMRPCFVNAERMLTSCDSAIKTSPSSRRPSSSATRPPVSWATPTTPPSGSRTRWPRRRRPCSTSSVISVPS